MNGQLQGCNRAVIEPCTDPILVLLLFLLVLFAWVEAHPVASLCAGWAPPRAPPPPVSAFQRARASRAVERVVEQAAPLALEGGFLGHAEIFLGEQQDA